MYVVVDFLTPVKSQQPSEQTTLNMQDNEIIHNYNNIKEFSYKIVYAIETCLQGVRNMHIFIHIYIQYSFNVNNKITHMRTNIVSSEN